MDQSRYADTVHATRHMFIRDLVLDASIGVHKHEHQAVQRVRINIDLAVTDEGAQANISRPKVGHDELARVVDWWKPWRKGWRRPAFPTPEFVSPECGWRNLTYSQTQHPRASRSNAADSCPPLKNAANQWVFKRLLSSL
jgi:hypothetical protein